MLEPKPKDEGDGAKNPAEDAGKKPDQDPMNKTDEAEKE